MTVTLERKPSEVEERIPPLPELRGLSPRRSLLLLVAGVLAITVGLGSVIGGAVGIVYTWGQAVEQGIVTPEDASIPNTPVRGPFTMKAQADIIEHHQLDRTGGLYYAEMPRQVQATDADGTLLFDDTGEPVMVNNDARTSWITATTLTTVLNLGIMAYALGAFAIVVGLSLLASGIVFLVLRRTLAAAPA
ncbi:MAG: hypothetical protein QY307_10715 [Acidimicrobiia bacterium]|nr:MAG: hypothetical protein QY307_10715 [Acidimicrobiia bacterium]